jgi:site-specific DNA recombinase
MKQIRCAIYTRKSSEEGLEQSFNSLDAQREACAAFVNSQKHEGWVLLPTHYDDGGLSGGTLERPALQELLASVGRGEVDQIVVYKIDRLTRSLTDFAKLVEKLDAAKASFVSVTQSFNTATSMGRLTLNVLLSFAQFEREVTAERIRDKIAASKRKGMWMGGNVPLGYDADGRTLKVNEGEAERVRQIFDLYLELGSVVAVKQTADRLGLTAKGGKPFSRGHVHYILSNPLYIGRIRHREKTHAGRHHGIIDRDLWDKVQAKLTEASARKRGRGNAATVSLLAGKLTDETGDRLTPSHANKQGRRYRYYVSNRLITKEGESGGGWRLPAKELEDSLAAAILVHLRRRLGSDLLRDASVEEIMQVESKLAALEPGSAPGRAALLRTLASASIRPGMIEMTLDGSVMSTLLGLDPERLNTEALTFSLPFRQRKRGVETRLVIGDLAPEMVDKVLVRNLAKAQQYYAALKNGETFDETAAEAGITKRRLLALINLAFLAPDIAQAILDGTQPLGLTCEWLQRNPLPLDWQEQRLVLASL